MDGIDKMKTGCRCAIYCRLSREDANRREPESESIRNQKNLLRRYALERGENVLTDGALVKTDRGTVLGVFGLAAWLGEKVHHHGQLLTPAQLVQNACGGPFDPTRYVGYLKKKYGELYGV